MSTGRYTFAWASLLAMAPFFTTDSHAGLCDCLFGRRAAPVVVGYAPQPAYAAGYAPQPVYAAGYAPQPVYSAGYAAVPVSPAPLPTSNGAIQLQRPAYIDNPSVYTGRPVVTTTANAQTVYSVPMSGAAVPATGLPQASSSQVPIAQTLRGTPAPFVSPGTIVSSNYSGGYQAGYPNAAAQTSAGLPLQTTTPVGTPPSAIPVTPVVPQFAPAPQPRRSGLGRFFDSILGTDYRTSYYQAPVTYYRPVTTVDPVTGAVVTVQQPCTATVQQLQRTPYTSLQLSPTTIAPQPQGVCQNGQPCAVQPYAAQPYSAQPYSAQPYAGATTTPIYGTPPMPQPSGIGQVGGISNPGSGAVAPIGSSVIGSGASPTAPWTPNTTPLSGAPPAVQQGDLAPIARPELQPAPQPRILRQQTTPPAPAPPSNNPAPESTNPPASYWDSPEADNSVAKATPATSQPPRLPDPKALATPRFTGVQPIPAPDDYESPFRRGNLNPRPLEPTQPNSSSFQAPPLLPIQEAEPAETSSASARLSVPVRDASLTRNHRWGPLESQAAATPTTIQPAPVRKAAVNSGWYTIEP